MSKKLIKQVVFKQYSFTLISNFFQRIEVMFFKLKFTCQFDIPFENLDMSQPYSPFFCHSSTNQDITIPSQFPAKGLNFIFIAAKQWGVEYFTRLLCFNPLLNDK